jgi:hypothetical protein
MQLPPGVLPVAIDHLQLRVELTLLKLLGHFRQKNNSDWLTNEVINKRSENQKLIDSIGYLSEKKSAAN